MRTTLTCAAFIAAALLCAPAAAQDEGYFQQRVDYTIRVSLDTAAHMLAGTETILYTNNSPDTLRGFYLHLYPNAYRSRHSAFMKFQRRVYNLNLLDIPEDQRGWLDVEDVRVDGEAVTVDVDDTIARMALPAPLAPGGSMTVSLAFRSKVRKHRGRAGYRGQHYDFAQWYPKVVVYDEKGFHPDKFMAGEFYGEFGTFDVHIELPAHYVVAATGVVAEGDAGWDYNPVGARRPRTPPEPAARKTVHFHAEDVHDFAWCADPSFVVQDTTVAGVVVRSFYRANNAKEWQDSTLAHGVRALEWLTRQFGPYPYPRVNVVDALLRGGMEYPMLVMDGRASEGLVVHEVGHIYFYGILANDERAEAWLDEGFTTFQTQWFKEKRYGPGGNRRELNWYQRITPQPRLWENYREIVFDLQRRGYGERVAKRAEEFNHSYHDHVYRKAALILNAVRYALGEETFRATMQDYYRRWQLKHVNEDRFRRVVEERAGVDLRLQFDQWLHTRKICDYRLAKVDVRESGDGYRAAVEVRRDGELFLPVEVVFELEDGSVQRYRLDGKPRTIKSVFVLPSKPKRTAINPDNEIMDIDLSDNFSPRRRRLQIDWPNNSYYPEDAYVIRHRPGVWYNDIDGLKAGYLLNGSYHGWRRRLQLGVYYGFLSDRVDFVASWVEPRKLFGDNATLSWSGYKMEGRRDARVEFRVHHRSKLMVPPSQDMAIGYGYHELTNPRYLASPEIYDTNRADVGPYFAFAIAPQADLFSTSLRLGLELGRKWTGGDYHYERFHAELGLHSRTLDQPVDARLRGFIGLSGGNVPTQSKFGLAGAGPLEQEKRFWLRSRGAVWPDLHYHEPGDGNLRGYYEGTFGANKLWAFNAEVGTRLYLIDRLLKPVLGTLGWYAFYDVGSLLDDVNPIASSTRVQGLVDAGILEATLQDAGIGLRSRRPLPFWDLRVRFDMPLWVSHPEVNGQSEETRFRYLFSLTMAF